MKTPFTAALMTLALTTGLFSCNKKQGQETAFKPRLDPDNARLPLRATTKILRPLRQNLTALPNFTLR